MMRKTIAAVQSLQWVGTRGKRILHTGTWSMVAKAAAAANLFLTVPFVLKALGPTEFGVWATLVSLITFASFLDFGLGNGTMNLVATAHGRGEDRQISTIVREGRRTLVLIALLLAGVSMMTLPWVPWHRLLGVPEAMSSTARVSVGIVIGTIILAVPLNLATRVQLGMGQGNLAFRWQAVGQALTACLVILLARAGADLEVLVAATVATPLLAMIANNVQLSRSAFWAQSAGEARDPAIAAAIRNEGMLFFVLQLAAALAFSADLPLISALRGPEEAGHYAIVQRLFSVIPMTLGLVWLPLWPQYRQALAIGDHGWVQRTLRNSLRAAVAIASMGALMLAFGFDWIAGIWIHESLHISGYLIAGFALWCVIDAAGTALATFLNAASIVRYQVFAASAFAVSCVAGKYIVLSKIGTWTLPWVTIATFTIANLIPILLLWPRITARVYPPSTSPYQNRQP
jgi:O-antigen/teichoic acid export membrane protein